MTLVAPLALAALAALVPVLLLYLVRRQPRQVATATLQFWDAASPPKKQQTLGRKLRVPLSLLIALAIVTLLAFALAEPVKDRPAEPLVIVLDNSMTLHAREGSSTRWEKAQEMARAALASKREGDPAAIVSAAQPPRVLCTWTTDAVALRRAIDSASNSDAPRRLPDAMALGKRMLDSAAGRTAIVSDGEKIDDAQVDWIGVPHSALANRSIIAFSARRSLHDPTGFELFVKIANYDQAKFEGTLEISIDGALFDTDPVMIEAGGIWQQSYRHVAAHGGLIEAHLTPDDALPEDNRAAAVLPAQEPLDIDLIVRAADSESFFLETALRACPLVRDVQLVKLPDPRHIAVYVGAAVPKILPDGPAFIVAPQVTNNHWSISPRDDDRLTNVRIAVHPLTAATRPERIPFGKILGFKWKEPQAVTILDTLNTDDGGASVLSAWERPNGRVVVLNSALERVLVFRTEFIVLVGNALAWLSGASDEPVPCVSAGQTLSIELPPGQWEMKSPRNGVKTFNHSIGKLDLGVLDEIGVWTLTSPEQATRRVTCNPATGCDPGVAGTTSESSSSGWTTRPLWFVLASTALALVVLEWIFYQRRWAA